MTGSGIPAAKRFQRGDRVYVQAQQVWLILVGFVMFSDRNARKPATITYGEVAVRMGYDSRAGHTLARQLGIVGDYCLLNQFPPLNTVVVTELTKQPGAEVIIRPGSSVRKDQAAVMKFNWFSVRVPTTATFRAVWEKD